MSKQPLLLTLPCLVAVLLLASCEASNSSVQRWYTAQQVTLGAKVFAKNCASCHGNKAQGLVKDWQTPLSDGSYPPPPLNGTGHAWHHGLPLLLEIIQQGGASYDGNMPAFAAKLNEEEQYAVIAWFQHGWTEERYQMWNADRSHAQGMMRNKE